ncbi:MAG: hypothetical protein HY974_01480 [Candidatus Kerfeldbacteria bacterium]|nr:hypothetical protein [Candidatus Kerfeldbacteria bacterium]
MMRFLPWFIFLLLVGGGFYYLNRGLFSTGVSSGRAVNSGAVIVESPKPDTLLTSPLTITGRALGTWFWEASFPILLVDANDKILGTTLAEAQGDWMSKAHVNFQAKLEFKQPATNTGALVFKKDNPSGLPENDAALEVPVRFK